MLPPRSQPPSRGRVRWIHRQKFMVGFLVAWMTLTCWWLFPRSKTASRRWDAVVVPGGGLNEDGTPYEFVRARLDAALRHDAETEVYIVLSRGTTHKPPPRDARGFAIDESVASARYLVDRGVTPSRILQDTWSVDTVGNVAFARLVRRAALALPAVRRHPSRCRQMLVEPRGWRRLLVITSDFHMPRVRAIFEWVFALPPRGGAAELSYESVPERGLAEEAREARAKKEAQALDGLRAGAMARVRDLAALHSFVFQEHRAYGAAPQSAAAAATAAEERAQGALASTY